MSQRSSLRGPSPGLDAPTPGEHSRGEKWVPRPSPARGSEARLPLDTAVLPKKISK